MSDYQPHTDTQTDSSTTLVISLIGLLLVLSIFATPWFFDDSPNGGPRPNPAYPVVAVQMQKKPGERQAQQQAYRDPPTYFGQSAQLLTPDMSNLPGVKS